MRTPRSLVAVGLTGLTALATLGLAACGSSTLPSGSSSSSEAAPSSQAESASSSSAPSSAASSSTVDAALAAALPADVKSAKVIKVGTDSSYAPNEFLAADGKTVQGMDVDLLNAVAARFGVKAEFQSANFDTIITGVQSGKYDVGISSFTINDKRKQQVNMISYFNAGTQWATKKGNPAAIDPANACGKSIGVQTGTVQQEDDLPARQAACAKAGKPKITVVVRDRQDQVNSDLASGKTQAMLADSPVVAYAVQKSGGQIATLGSIYEAAPYGVVVPKKETAFAQAIAKAFTQTKADGSYEAALKKWNNSGGAISTFAVNPSVSG